MLHVFKKIKHNFLTRKKLHKVKIRRKETGTSNNEKEPTVNLEMKNVTSKSKNLLIPLRTELKKDN